VKAAIEVWGYRGNGLGWMRSIRQQFDPNGLLSPGRVD
jgi:glycolate oxidase FAD binding subunit